MIDPDYYEEDHEDISGEDLFSGTFRDIVEETMGEHGLIINPLNPIVPQHILDELEEGDGIHLTQQDVRALYGLPPLEKRLILPTQRIQDTPRSLPRYTPRRPYARLDLPTFRKDSLESLFPPRGLDSFYHLF